MTGKEKEAKIAAFEEEREEIKKHRKPAGQSDKILIVAQQNYKDEKSKLDVAKGQEIRVNRDPEIEAKIKASLDNIEVKDNDEAQGKEI